MGCRGQVEENENQRKGQDFVKIHGYKILGLPFIKPEIVL